MRCEKFKAGSRENIRMALRPNEQRDNSTDLCAAGREYYGAIDLAVGPDVLLAKPLKSGKASSLTGSTRKSHECRLAATGFRLKGEL